MAVNGVNRVLSRAVLPPIRTVIVLTTLSLAVKPVIRAVDNLQSPKPSGAKIGAIHPPTRASMLSWESATTLRWISKVCRNQMMMVATKMTEMCIRDSLIELHDFSLFFLCDLFRKAERRVAAVLIITIQNSAVHTG